MNLIRQIFRFATGFAQINKYSNERKDRNTTTAIFSNIKLNNGRSMPVIGIGTWQSRPGQVAQFIKDAIDVGFRRIDAHIYENEHEVGEAINAKINEGVATRKELFITSKLWNSYHRPDLVRGACEKTLKNLNTPYVDMYLIHCGKLSTLKDEQEMHNISDVDYVDTWKEMEKLVDHGLCKSIGVSNFNRKQIERVLKIARIPPTVNQVECHPYLNHKKLMEFCKRKNIAVMAIYNPPLGKPNHPNREKVDVPVLKDPNILCIAKKYNKTPAQILMRYQIQRGNIVVPKSVTNKRRNASNTDDFNFTLSSEDVEILDSFECDLCTFDSIEKHGWISSTSL